MNSEYISICFVLCCDLVHIKFTNILQDYHPSKFTNILQDNKQMGQIYDCPIASETTMKNKDRLMKSSKLMKYTNGKPSAYFMGNTVAHPWMRSPQPAGIS